MKIEVREDKVIIDGYVNAVDRNSKVLRKKNGKKFIEKIMPKVFQRALEKNDNVKVLLNHNHDRELANTKDGTAKLYEDNIGLRAIVEISDEEVIKKAKENKLRGWSFGFVCNKEDTSINDKGIEERTVKDMDLDEVSILDDKKIPAYIATSIEMRDGEVKEVEFRTTDESNDDKKTNEKSMTSSMKRELLRTEFNQSFPNGWLEDFDDEYLYGTIKSDNCVYKISYSINDGVVAIDPSKMIKVIRGGYIEVREDPEQHPKKEVEKINYEKYEKIIRELKEE